MSGGMIALHYARKPICINQFTGNGWIKGAFKQNTFLHLHMHFIKVKLLLIGYCIFRM